MIETLFPRTVFMTFSPAPTSSCPSSLIDPDTILPVPARICIAGSINSFARIDTMFDIGPWTFTMGSALFEKKFLPEGSFRENLIAVADYMAKK